GRPSPPHAAAAVACARHNFVFASLIGLALFNSVFGMSYITLLPVYADVYFQTGSSGYGVLNAAHGAGALAGTLTVATIAHLFLRRGTVIMVGATCLGVLLMVFSQSPVIWAALALLLLVGFSTTFYLTPAS